MKALPDDEAQSLEKNWNFFLAARKIRILRAGGGSPRVAGIGTERFFLIPRAGSVYTAYKFGPPAGPAR
jgi:hypothetical protein